MPRNLNEIVRSWIQLQVRVSITHASLYSYKKGKFMYIKKIFVTAIAHSASLLLLKLLA